MSEIFCSYIILQYLCTVKAKMEYEKKVQVALPFGAGAY